MKTIRILVVDDQAVIAQDLVMKVLSMGYTGCSVGSGNEAIKISRNFKPDLILMDVNLKGGKDGIQTARVIQQFTKIPVLFVTGYSPVSVLNESLDLVLTGCIQKPFDKQELQVSIRKLLDAA